MKRTIVTCDICGCEKNVKTFNLPVYRSFDACDGRTFYEKPNIEFRQVDICEDCLMKVTNLHDKSVMGYGELIIDPVNNRFKKLFENEK